MLSNSKLNVAPLRLTFNSFVYSFDVVYSFEGVVGQEYNNIFFMAHKS
jgi:hypothetical protein